MTLLTRLQLKLRWFGLGLIWPKLMFATVLMLLVFLVVMRQEGLNVLAKASTQLQDMPKSFGASQISWNTIFEIDALALNPQMQATMQAQAMFKPTPSSRYHSGQYDHINGEGFFLQTYQLLSDGQHAQALQVAQTMAERFPNFQLGHLLYADLMASAAGLDQNKDALLQNPIIQERLNQLKIEALQRTRNSSFNQFEGKVPAQVRYLSPSVPMVAVVDAQKSRLYLLAQGREGTGKSQLHVVFDAYVSIGSQGIGKWREGDAKTPAGVYFIQKYLTDPMLPDLYGSGALTLDYPNPIDKLLQRTGSGIWLHGSPSQQYARPPTATDGCVVLANDDMTRLVQHGMRADTPVIIAEQLSWVDSGYQAADSTRWPQPISTQQTSGDWTLISAFEWVDQARTVAVLTHEIRKPGQPTHRRHSYWVKGHKQWQEVSHPI